MLQIINFENVENVIFDNKEVKKINLNNIKIWETSAVPTIPYYTDGTLFYTGLDINGNYENTENFDGTIVAYALGRAVYELSGETLMIRYKNSNGFDYLKFGITIEEIENGLENVNSINDIPNTLSNIEIVIPDYFNEKPVIEILGNAILGGVEIDGVIKVTSMSKIKSIKLNNFINELGGDGFFGYTALSNFIDNRFEMQPITQFLNLDFNKFALIENVFNNTFSKETNIILGETTAYGSSFKGVKSITLNKPQQEYSNIVGGLNVKLSYVQEAIIFGENVNQIKNITLSTTEVGKYWVFKQPQNFNVEIIWDGIKPKTAGTCVVYTDNLSVRLFDWVGLTNCTPTFYPLSQAPILQ